MICYCLHMSITKKNITVNLLLKILFIHSFPEWVKPAFFCLIDSSKHIYSTCYIKHYEHRKENTTQESHWHHYPLQISVPQTDSPCTEDSWGCGPDSVPDIWGRRCVHREWPQARKTIWTTNEQKHPAECQHDKLAHTNLTGLKLKLQMLKLNWVSSPHAEWTLQVSTVQQLSRNWSPSTSRSRLTDLRLICTTNHHPQQVFEQTKIHLYLSSTSSTNINICIVGKSRLGSFLQ